MSIVWIDEASPLINWTAAANWNLLVTMKTNQDLVDLKANTSNKPALGLRFLLIAGLLLFACKQQANAGNGVDPTGVYTLVSVDGKKVPASISHDGAVLQVRSGTLTIKADGTCSTKTVFVPPSGTEATREVSATYTQEGAKLTMRWKGAGMTNGTVKGKTFTMDNEGMVFVYRK